MFIFILQKTFLLQRHSHFSLRQTTLSHRKRFPAGILNKGGLVNDYLIVLTSLCDYLFPCGTNNNVLSWIMPCLLSLWLCSLIYWDWAESGTLSWNLDFIYSSETLPFSTTKMSYLVASNTVPVTKLLTITKSLMSENISFKSRTGVTDKEHIQKVIDQWWRTIYDANTPFKQRYPTFL